MTAVTLFVVTALLYGVVSVPELANRSDPLLIAPTSLSVLHDGDLELSELGAEIDPRFYGVVYLDGRPYNRYPVGASLLVLPIVWVADRVLPPGPTPMTHALAVAAVTAKVVAALGVAMLFVLLVALMREPRLALGLALVFGFATVHLPIHGGGLFTHNAVIPVLLAALLLLVHRDGRYAASSAIPLAVAFATRPTCAPVIAALSLYVAFERRAALPAFLVLGVGLAFAFIGWSAWMYGEPLPPYYTRYDHTSAYVLSATRFAQGLVGHLVSPNRGVFVFSPILLLSVYGMVAAWTSPDRHAPLYRALAVAVVVYWVTISLIARKWWAGWSFGPRHVVEIFPLLVILLVPAIQAMRTWSRRARVTLAPFAAAALAWSLFVAIHGATSSAPGVWNHDPQDVDLHPERVWDWHDMQILRGAPWR